MSERREIGMSLRPEEARELLPWFKTGRLSREEDEAIEDLLRGSADLRRQLEDIRLERPLPTANAGHHPAGMAGIELSRLLHQLEHSRQRHAAPDIQPSRKAPRTHPPFARQSVLALTLLVVLLAIGTLMPNFLRQYAPDLLSGATDQTAPAIVAGKIQVIFQPEATMEEISRLLTEIRAQIVSGPGPGLTFVLGLDEPGNLDATMRHLQSRPDIVLSVEQPL